MKTTAKLSAVIGALLLTGALFTAGCDNTEDNDCVGAGCLNPIDDVDSGGLIGSDLPCTKVCGNLFDACGGMALPKLDSEQGPASVEDCVILCEKGLTLDERRCLFEAGCDGASMCLESDSDL